VRALRANGADVDVSIRARKEWARLYQQNRPGGSLKLPTSCSAFAERVTGLEPVYTALQAAA
jgi:hypothetical protein